MFGFARGLADLSFEVETKKNLDFASNRPKVLTYQSAKGLTFDTVLMPRLVQSSFTRESEDLIERLLFVGITRAMTWVYLSSTEPDSLPALEEIWEAEDTGSLAVQEAGEVVGVGAKAPSTGTGKDGDDGLLGLL
jgi:superfamily I DNA/RNA helicase